MNFVIIVRKMSSQNFCQRKGLVAGGEFETQLPERPAAAYRADIKTCSGSPVRFNYLQKFNRFPSAETNVQ